ncbi:MAG: 2-amino-4-hydroxy-6-hydroxymethyldihydropteridine diphosphokinase [Gammaproteobacteria bacterium]|nr:2-amino-4-hydroxy-6-hydroxymethyldihydropteridine diphosphokinase [Gammaproteobacteria bacterium]
MVKVYVSVGSNIEREQNIRSGVAHLRQQFGDLMLSSVYESVAVGFEGDNFYNLVVGFEATDAWQANDILHQIEYGHGRRKGGKKFAARTLDMDLLLFGDSDLRLKGLDVPREEITRYAFVLGPLAEIAPRELHPTLKTSYLDMWISYRNNAPSVADSIWPVLFAW